MTHSVESRFIAIVSGTLLALVTPLVTILLMLSHHESITNQRDRLEILLVANSQALGRPLWDLDDDAINQITGTLVTDPDIYMVKVTDTFGQLDVTQTAGSAAPEDGSSITRDITYKNLDGETKVGTITVFFRNVGLLTSVSRIELSFFSIFILTVVTIFGVAVIGNRLMIMKPLLRLTAAIEATRRLGSRHHVDWRSTDEMGRLARSFNEMQIQLDREEQEIKKAHRRTTEIYNRTPAMLFSLDQADRIAAVSDYWVEATGYTRSEVLGRSFVDLIAAEDRNRFILRKHHEAATDGMAGSLELTLRFKRRDGNQMDVLIAEKALGLNDEDQGSEGLSVMTDVTELRRSEQRNRMQAITDHLTGLFNRQGFEAILDEKILEADENGTELACLFIDLDRFKIINDNLGHGAGDAVLQEFVERLKSILSPLDSASRLGGDEFAVLLAGQMTESRATEISDMICTIFDTPFDAMGNSVRLSASIGVALYPSHAKSASELLQNSDMAMYSRKRAGKNGAQMFDPAIMNKARERAEIEQDIEQALENGWLEAYFQPIQQLQTGRTLGFEALMRLNHPTKGILSPAAIISVAEENGNIGRIGNAILDESIRNLSKISKLPGLESAYVAVNFSALQFEPGLPTRIAGLLYRYNIVPSRLVVEITEAVLMHDDPQIRAVMNTIRELGCRIALDDFGTGYSSLSYLNRFPVDIVKIDQSFTRAIEDEVSEISQRSRMLVEGISAISHKMNCTVIAEGIETLGQKAMLRDIGVDCGQGYLFARPQPVSVFLAEFEDHDSRIAKVGT